MQFSQCIQLLRRVVTMATLTIRDLDDDVKRRLRMRAAEKGVSMEAEARSILSAAVADAAEKPGDWYRRFRAHVEAVGGLDDLIPYLPDRKADELIPTSRRIPFVGDPEFDDSAREDSARDDSARDGSARDTT